MELPNKKELNQLDILQDQVISYPSKETVANQNKKIEKILILDTETTGLDENKNETCESTHLCVTSNKIAPISITSFIFSSKPVVSVSRIKIFSFFLFWFAKLSSDG